MKDNYYSKNLVPKPLLLFAILLLIVIVILSFPLIGITGATTNTSTTITNNVTAPLTKLTVLANKNVTANTSSATIILNNKGLTLL